MFNSMHSSSFGSSIVCVCARLNANLTFAIEDFDICVKKVDIFFGHKLVGWWWPGRGDLRFEFYIWHYYYFGYAIVHCSHAI